MQLTGAIDHALLHEETVQMELNQSQPLYSL